ncbi:MAG: hypothetical protein SFT81_05570 [Candidatus Caenarcaniphilales bacterium]|nr:hypothetical protein [Candidatus Caenarcaniphilales bacterium]
MDFRNASYKLDNHEITEEDLTEQILNLPCVYAIFQTQSKIFCLEVHNRENNAEITVALLFSNLQIAVEATNLYNVPHDWFIAQWSSVEEALQACLEVDVDGVALDSLPHGDTLNGLVIDKQSLQELVAISLTGE